MGKTAIENPVFSAEFDGRGAMTALRFRNDPYGANFVLSSEDEKWVPEEKQWGLGFLSLGHERAQITECTERCVRKDTAEFTYRVSITDPRHCCTWPSGPAEEDNRIRYDLVMLVTRALTEEGLLETFLLCNPSAHYIALDEIGIYSSFHDTYAEEDHALERHMNQHFFTGGDISWIEAPRQSGNPPHAGLVTLEGKVSSFQTEEVNSSNFRGVIALISKEVRIAPGKAWSLSRLVFPYNDRSEFGEIICRKTGFPILDYGFLTVTPGESFRFRFLDRGRFESAAIGGIPMEDDGSTLSLTPPRPGEYTGKIRFSGGKIARLRLRALDDPAKLLRQRADFIIRHQQLRDPEDPRDGAFLCFDDRTEKLVLPEDIEGLYYSIPDRNDARERIGMGAFLAVFARVFGDSSVLPALRRYDAFLEKYIIDEEFNVWDNYERQKGARWYSPLLNTTLGTEPDMSARTFNYCFGLAYEAEMYRLTGEKKYAETCAGIFRRYRERFGIGGNVCMFGIEADTVRVLEDAGLAEDAKQAAAYLRERIGYLREIDDRYDPSEVIYEQFTAAGAMREITDYYLTTGDRSVLDLLERTRERTRSFEGAEPDYRSFHIPVRHWDGFWFGGLERWGDTMPHYWTSISADAYCKYAKIPGNEEYEVLAEHIFRGSLALIRPGGSCSNSYLAPEKVNGRPAGCEDPLANDQDWAFFTYLRQFGDRFAHRNS